MSVRHTPTTACWLPLSLSHSRMNERRKENACFQFLASIAQNQHDWPFLNTALPLFSSAFLFFFFSSLPFALNYKFSHLSFYGIPGFFVSTSGESSFDRANWKPNIQSSPFVLHSLSSCSFLFWDHLSEKKKVYGSQQPAKTKCHI